MKMFKKRCNLCGGELVNGYCVECGLDNNKQRMYSAEDEFKKEQQEMEVEDVFHRQEQIDYSHPKKKDFITTLIEILKPKSNENKKKTSPLKRIIIIFIVLTVLSNVLGVVFAIFASFISSTTTNDVTDFSEIEYYNEVDFGEALDEVIELEETGDEYSVTLVAGYYEVGVHIPEGSYDITCVSEGTININDEANDISVYAYFWDENVGETYEGVQLYKGAHIQLKNEAVFQFETENANYSNYEVMSNPNTESFKLTTGISVAGEDFPAGVYDFYMPANSFSVVRVYESIEEYNDEDSYQYESMFMSNTSFDGDDEYQLSECYNMIIPEGYVIYISNEEEYIEYLEITPSVMIKDESYTPWYDFNKY